MATNAPETVIKKRPHTYNQEERNVLNESVTTTLDKLDELEREKKRVSTELKAKEADLESKLTTTRNNLRQGYEPREYVCNVLRDVTTKTVSYVDQKTGDVIDSHKFGPADWDAINGETQMDLFADTTPDAEGAAPMPKLFPNSDDNGNVVAGPATDLFNMTYTDSPYRHLSEAIDFNPVLPSTGHDELDAEKQVYFNETIAHIAYYDRAQLEAAIPNFEAATTQDGREISSDYLPVHALIVQYIQERIKLLDLTAKEDGSFYTQDGDGESTTTVQDAEDDGPEGGADDDEEGDDDEPEKPKRTPTRPANRKMPRGAK